MPTNKHVLLTGAGFSRNWGAWTASEFWEQMIGHREVQNRPELREFLLNEMEFETAVAEARSGAVSAELANVLEGVIRDCFDSIDRAIKPPLNAGIHFYGVERLLNKFCGLVGAGPDSGYFFTLNQDMLLERKFVNHHDVRPPALPGIRIGPNHGPFGGNFGFPDQNVAMSIQFDPNHPPSLRKASNYIKLHGSANWLLDGQRPLMVIGNSKTQQVAEIPLLKWYHHVFESVLNTGEIRLMIIGYGFGDEHINRAIAEGVRNSELHLMIWDIGTAQQIREKVTASPYGERIWAGLITTVTRPMAEVFPGNQDETETYRQIVRQFFV